MRFHFHKQTWYWKSFLFLFVLDLGGFASSFFSGFFGNQQQHRQQSHQSSYPSGGEDSGSLLVVAVLLLLAYGVYKLFLSGNTAQDRGQAGYPRDNNHGFTAGPPPPGFKPDYTGSWFDTNSWGVKLHYSLLTEICNVFFVFICQSLSAQTPLVPTQATVSVATTRMDSSTQGAELLPAQVEVFGLAWGQAVCWDIFLAVRG